MQDIQNNRVYTLSVMYSNSVLAGGDAVTYSKLNRMNCALGWDGVTRLLAMVTAEYLSKPQNTQAFLNQCARATALDCEAMVALGASDADLADVRAEVDSLNTKASLTGCLWGLVGDGRWVNVTGDGIVDADVARILLKPGDTNNLFTVLYRVMNGALHGDVEVRVDEQKTKKRRRR